MILHYKANGAFTNKVQYHVKHTLLAVWPPSLFDHKLLQYTQTEVINI